MRAIDAGARVGLTAVAGSLLLSALILPAHAATAPPTCAPGGDTVVLDGQVATTDAKSYLLLPFQVAPGTTRVEVAYDWADLDPVRAAVPMSGTVVDLGLWDGDGTSGADAFRGWGGSRQGRISRGQAPVWVQADTADRGFTPGVVEPGVWHVELGFGNVNSGGGSWHVELSCRAPDVGTTPVPDPVNRDHVARADAGWFHGDMHMHAFHSNPAGPTPDEVVQHAREVGLDFLPITEYVTTRHQGEWGATARANPDLIIWPGREVITYFGHANVLGETPGVIDYRHGYEEITLGDIQARSVAAGALFQINHPTFFPDPLLTSFCRGCEFNLEPDIDLSLVDTVEVLTGPIEVGPEYVGLPPGPGIENPFVATAVAFYEQLLLDGHRVAPVSGSDEKQVEGHGSSVTAVYADALSRPSLEAGLRAMQTYVRTRGVADSPTIDVTATDGTDTVMLGGTLAAQQATLTVTVEGAAGQVVELTRNGQPLLALPVASDSQTFEVPITRTADDGPLGTFHRVDVRESSGIRSLISSAIFLSDAVPPTRGPGDANGPTDGATASETTGASPDPSPDPDPLARTGGGSAALLGATGLSAAAMLWQRRRRR